jgi:hypothetical protein
MERTQHVPTLAYGLLAFEHLHTAMRGIAFVLALGKGKPPTPFDEEREAAVEAIRAALENPVAQHFARNFTSHEQLRTELANAAHRVRWLMQFANVDKEPIEQELAKWDALSSAKATP